MAKKILALVLAVMMIAALSVSAFATNSDGDRDEGKIIISNAQEGITYTAYKIFDVTYDGNGSYAYTISSTSPWLPKLEGFFETAPTADATVLTVKPKKDFSAPAFAAALKLAGVTDPSAKPITGGKISGLALGYWFVTTTSGSLCNLTTTDPASTIYDKNEKIIPKKEVDDKDVEVGQPLIYTATVELPKDVTGYKVFNYELYDHMSSGLTYNWIISVVDSNGKKYEVADIPRDATITYKHSGRDATQGYEHNGFDFAINLAEKDSSDNLLWKDFLGKKLTITYQATVNENAIERNKESNELKLKYSNDPNKTSSYEDVPPVIVDVYSVNIGVYKVADKTDNPLKDAKFVLYKETGANKEKEYYKWDETNKKVTWVPLGEYFDIAAALEADKTFCTVRNTVGTGKLNQNFNGIEAGTYYLEEIDSPLGYVLPSEAFTVDIDENGESGKIGEVSVSPDSALTFEGTIANIPGQELPETGGIGTTIFYVLGSVFVLGAAVVLLSKKRA